MHIFFVQCPGTPDYPVPAYDFGTPQTPFFRSEPCRPGFNKREAFTWNGKIVDGRFQGPGKFKNNGIDEGGNTLEVCYSKTDMFGNQIGNITGTYVRTYVQSNTNLRASKGRNPIMSLIFFLNVPLIDS